MDRPHVPAQGRAGSPGVGQRFLGSDPADTLPDINVLTFHPRYHSFYTFLLDEFWQRDRPRSHAAWVRFYRPREFIFSLGAYLCDQPEHGEMRNVVGGQRTEGLAARREAAYDTTFDYIKSDLGGYGLYYRSVIIQLGLVLPGGRGLPLPVDVPSEAGKRVAEAFRSAVRDTVYYCEYFDQDATHVPLDVIRAYIRRACLCQLQQYTAPDRPLLLDAFLHAGTDPAARRATFCMLLDLAAQTQGVVVNEDVFRQLLFFGAADNGARYAPGDSVVEAYRRWRLYQAREYYAYALNALWYHICEWGLAQHGDVRPIHLNALHAYLEQALDFAALAARLNVPAPALNVASGFRALLDWLQQVAGVSPTDDFDAACTLATPLHEHRLYCLAEQYRSAPDVMVAGMLTMLALTYLRFGKPERWVEADWDISCMGADGRLSVDGFVRTLHRRLRSGPVTIGEIARWLLEDYVILQHQLVATGKLPENTFRFQREGQRLHFYPLDNSLGFMNSRFDALSTTLHELGLCGDLRQADHPLRPDGRRLLEEGDLP